MAAKNDPPPERDLDQIIRDATTDMTKRPACPFIPGGTA